MSEQEQPLGLHPDEPVSSNIRSSLSITIPSRERTSSTVPISEVIGSVVDMGKETENVESESDKQRESGNIPPFLKVIDKYNKVSDGYAKGSPAVSQGCQTTPHAVSQPCHSPPHVVSQTPAVSQANLPQAAVSHNRVTKFHPKSPHGTSPITQNRVGKPQQKQTLSNPGRGDSKLVRINLSNPGRGDGKLVRGNSVTTGISRKT